MGIIYVLLLIVLVMPRFFNSLEIVIGSIITLSIMTVFLSIIFSINHCSVYLPKTVTVMTSVWSLMLISFN